MAASPGEAPIGVERPSAPRLPCKNTEAGHCLGTFTCRASPWRASRDEDHLLPDPALPDPGCLQLLSGYHYSSLRISATPAHPLRPPFLLLLFHIRPALGLNSAPPTPGLPFPDWLGIPLDLRGAAPRVSLPVSQTSKPRAGEGQSAR